MIKKLIIGFLVLLAAFAFYIKWAISKFDYDYKITYFKPVKIDLKDEAIFNITLKVFLKSSFFFPVTIGLLYYEIYFKGNLLGKSTGESSFVMKPKPNITEISQNIDLYVNKGNMEVATNYALKIPTEYTAKIIAEVAGIKFTLKDIKFIY